MGALSTYLLDIIIAVVALVVIISSFFKPTFKYVRWLVGMIVAGLVVILIKTVKFFNFVETAIYNFANKIHFNIFCEKFFKFFKGDLMTQSKINQGTTVMVLVVVGLIVFVIINLLMGLSHRIKVRRSNKKGNYVYSKPFGSFILSLICVVFGVAIITITFKALPFSVNYVSQENSIIMYYTYSILNNLFDLLKSVIPGMGSLDDYIRLITVA